MIILTFFLMFISNSYAYEVYVNAGTSGDKSVECSVETGEPVSIPSEVDAGIARSKCKNKFLEMKKEEKKENEEECEKYKPDIETITKACAKAGISGGKCTETLRKCSADQKSSRRRSSGSSSRSKTDCSFLNTLSYDDAKDAADDAKDDFEDSEEKLQDLQDKLTEAQEDALEKQQSTEEKITALQNEINDIPNRATELALKNEAERDKLLLTHIDNMNAVTDDIQGITDAIHDAETALINKRNELLGVCELEARGKQQAKIADKNQKKSAGRNTVKSLSEALQTTYATTKDGKKILRNTKEIIARFERCQKTRLHQTGIEAAERSYQRTLIALESRRKSIEKKTRSLEARLETSLKLNNKTSELEMAGLAREQASKSQQVLMLQKQLMENKQQAEANIQKIQQSIQKAQYDQYAKTQSMMTSVQVLSNSSGRRGGKLKEEDIDTIYDAIGIVSSADEEEIKTFMEEKGKECKGVFGLRGIGSGSR